LAERVEFDIGWDPLLKSRCFAETCTLPMPPHTRGFRSSLQRMSKIEDSLERTGSELVVLLVSRRSGEPSNHLEGVELVINGAKGIS
jgi:hypothetical protein